MKKRMLLIATVLAVGFGMLLMNAGNTLAGEADIVKIWAAAEGEAKSLKADPPVLNVTKNTIVVWMNGVPEKEVQIVFEEGKTCRDVTANPNLKVPGFFLDSKNCYVTSFLPYAATTTLQFVEVGTYEYEVVNADGKLKTKGKIVVSD